MPRAVTGGRSAAEPAITWLQAAVTVGVTVVLFAVAGVVGGWLWAQVVQPPSFEAAGAVDTDALVLESFDIDAWFLVIGFVGGLLTGFAATALFRTRGLVTLVAVLAGAVVATLLVRSIGGALGPPPISEQTGDVVHLPLQVAASAAYFAWPVGAVLGLIAAITWLTPVTPISRA